MAAAAAVGLAGYSLVGSLPSRLEWFVGFLRPAVRSVATSRRAVAGAAVEATSFG